MACHSRQFCYLKWSHIWVPQPLDRSPGLGFSAFARHYLRNHYCFLFLTLLRCFSSGGALFIPMNSVQSLSQWPRGFPIRKSPDQSLTAAPRRLSQPSTSFFGVLCQGIHWTLKFYPCIPFSFENTSLKNLNIALAKQEEDLKFWEH